MNDEAMRWSAKAACRTECDAGRADPADWFQPTGNHPGTALALAICKPCPVRLECLRWAVKHQEWGIWGGMSHDARQRLRWRVRDCDECGLEFVYQKTRGGDYSLCSDECRETRRRRVLARSFQNRKTA